MAYYKFVKAALEDKPIEVYNNGEMQRDFTYIDDIVDGTIKSMELTGYNLINLGNNKPSQLNRLIKLIENKVNKNAIIKYEPFHKADMLKTWANIDKAKELINWRPKIELEDGIDKTIRWHLEEENFLKQIKY
jgi:nucleoside-diphosphate-sugar epimerase